MNATSNHASTVAGADTVRDDVVRDGQVDEDTEGGSPQEVLHAVLADTASFFRGVLEDPIQGRRARRMLAMRKLPLLSAEDGIGCAPSGWNALTRHLQGLGYTDEHLLAAGVSVTARTGNLIDRLRDRVTFAVHDSAGRVVAFTARAFPDDLAAAATEGRDLAKYVNTNETSLYVKSATLYGFTPRVLELLANGAVPVLTEGSIDALAVTLAGRDTHVGLASCGTALSEAHLLELDAVLQARGTSLAERGVVVAFDSDPAGRSASTRAWSMLTARGVRPLELALHGGEDPGSTPRTQLAAALESAEPLFLSLITDAITPWNGRLHEVAAQVFAVRAGLAYLRSTTNCDDINRGVATIAARTGVDVRFIVEELLDIPELD
ncbi:MAG: toprim domain-containing protein [Janthinobacterium lividum]